MRTVGKWTDGDDNATPRTDGHGWPMDVVDAKPAAKPAAKHESTTTSSGCPLMALQVLACVALLVALLALAVGG